MNILCTICSDLVNQSESVYVTQCGHIFHHHCLAQWIARSKSCPQCRNKVTDKTVYRIYPTISNECSAEDAVTLQSRLDDVQLQLRQEKAAGKKTEDQISELNAELKKKVEQLQSTEDKLSTKITLISALQQQLEYVKVQNKETVKLKEENQALKQNLQTMTGLQKVLNATTEEVERMMQGYTDVRTVATFATALKRALCESESKKNETRDKLQTVKQQLSAEKSKMSDMQLKLKHLEDAVASQRKPCDTCEKRKVRELDVSILDDSFEPALKRFASEPNQVLQMDDEGFPSLGVRDLSFGSMVRNIENSDSPYLRLKQGSIPLPKPSTNSIAPKELAILNSVRQTDRLGDLKLNTALSKHSIFTKKQPPKLERAKENEQSINLDVSYDGLGGHSKPDVFPKPKQPLKSLAPKLTAKHKLKRPSASTGNHDITKMLDKLRDK